MLQLLKGLSFPHRKSSILLDQHHFPALHILSNHSLHGSCGKTIEIQAARQIRSIKFKAIETGKQMTGKQGDDFFTQQVVNIQSHKIGVGKVKFNGGTPVNGVVLSCYYLPFRE